MIRTYSAGVHFGELELRKGKEVALVNTRRVWYWSGAASLSQLALKGGDDKSKISVVLPKIILTEAIEIIPCQPQAIKWFKETPEWKI